MQLANEGKSGILRPQRMVRKSMEFRRFIASSLFVITAAVGLTACERSVAGSCSTAQDAASKLTILTDELTTAQLSDRLEMIRVGDLGARILEAGTKFSLNGNHQAYCTALEKIRSEAQFR